MYQPWSPLHPWGYVPPTSYSHVPHYPYAAHMPSIAPMAPMPIMPFPSPAKQSSVLEQFKTKDGTYDITKMMNTMGQAVHVMNQMTGLVKGLTQAFKI